ncbi:MAG: MFS transporter [Candidatus Lokiarchaeota archaeon]|nr:MFS transporter [Candidatus Lokiarchaeota archaeon]MBD3202200.1 MFS transporter [Candidatus Lokiarchaeota archaeon]
MFFKSKQSALITHDFTSMIQIVILNSVGFYFLEFLIQYFTSQQLSASGLQIGLIYSILVIGHMLSSTFVGWITDKTKSKTKLILIGSFGRGFSYFIIYFSIIYSNLALIAIGMFTLGFFAGFFWIPFDTLIAEKSHKNARSYAYGKRDSAIGIGIFVGSVIGFTLFGILNYLTPNNWYFVYIGVPIFGCANIVAGVQFLRKVDENIKYKEESTEEYKFNQKKASKGSHSYFYIGLFFLLIALLFSNINGSLAKPFLNVYLLEKIENNPILAVFGFLPGYIISLVIAPKIGKYIDKIKPTIGITISSLLGALFTWLLISTSNLWIFSILLIIDYTIVNSANLVLNNFLSRISLKHRGKVMSLNSMCKNLGNITGPIIGGLVWDYISITAPFIISIFVELLLIPIYLVGIFYLKPHLTEQYEVSESLIETV